MGTLLVNNKIVKLIALEDFELDGKKLTKGDSFNRVGSSAIFLIERNKAVRFEDNELNDKGDKAVVSPPPDTTVPLVTKKQKKKRKVSDATKKKMSEARNRYLAKMKKQLEEECEQ